MKTMSKREKIMGVATLLICLVAVFKYGYMHFAAKQNLLSAQLSALTVELQTLKLQRAGLEQGRQPASVESQSALQATIQLNRQFAGMVREISNNLETDKLQILNLQTEQSVVASGYYKISYLMDTQTTFLAIGSFLEKFAQSKLLVEINAIDFNRDGGDLRRILAKIKVTNFVAQD